MFWVQEVTNDSHNDPNYKLFMAENPSDISNLPTITAFGKQSPLGSSINRPCVIGCECYVVSTGKKYILNTSGSWVENKAAESSGGGGGGGGDTTDYSQLTNLPTINGKVLTGDVTSKQLGLEDDVEYQAEGENLVLFKVPPTDGGN